MFFSSARYGSEASFLAFSQEELNFRIIQQQAFEIRLVERFAYVRTRRESVVRSIDTAGVSHTIRQRLSKNRKARIRQRDQPVDKCVCYYIVITSTLHEIFMDRVCVRECSEICDRSVVVVACEYTAIDRCLRLGSGCRLINVSYVDSQLKSQRITKLDPA